MGRWFSHWPALLRPADQCLLFLVAPRSVMRKKRVHSQMTIDAQIQQLQLMMS